MKETEILGKIGRHDSNGLKNQVSGNFREELKSFYRLNDKIWHESNSDFIYGVKL